ncbi:hypothetical protein FJZ48_01095 [Candidatus Uhrbacteria bacterium]|nr:hypothetical protein [Candidatus Uhrbacteria bacterium]
MSSVHFQKYPDGWIKIWIGIGLLGFLAILFFVTLAQGTFLTEQQRFIACSKQQRTDCDPSFFWMMNDWELPYDTVPVKK